MAEYRIINWNLEVIGPTCNNNWNTYAFFNYVAAVSQRCSANVIVIQEIITSAANNARQWLLGALPTGWNALDPMPARPEGDRESYLFLWKDGAGFSPLTLEGVLYYGTAGVRFPGNPSQRTDGRRPAYLGFQSDTGGIVVATNYHAPGMIGTTQVACLQLLGTLPQLKTNPPATLALCGDYNIDILTQSASYTALTQPTNTTPSVVAATHLLPYTAGADYTTVDECLNFGYDNIFVSAGTQPGTDPATVVDLIGQGYVQLPNGPVGYFCQCTDTFVPDRPSGKLYTGMDEIDFPPTSLNQSYILVRQAISDHLPVFTAFRA